MSRGHAVRGGVLAAGAAVWVLSLAIVAFRFDRGWIPADEGTIAQSAERLLHGELPHRDFDESYTGGLTALHALSFRVLGVRLLSLRWLLLLFFAAFVPALFFVASRVARPTAAAATVLAAVAWSVPNYFASMPSWYVLFFAVFGVAALFRYVETDRLGWLVAAGALAGLGCLVIVVGVYFVAAALLFLLFHETVAGPASEPPAGPHARRFRPGLATAGAAGFLLLLLALLRRRLGPAEALHFVAPAVALGAVLLRADAVAGEESRRSRRRRLATSLAAFGAGLALAVFPLFAVYAARGALPDLLRGLFLLPQRRFGSAWMSPPSLAALLPAAPYLLVLAAPALFVRSRRAGTVVFAALLAALLLVSARTGPYRMIWNAARALPVAVVLIGCAALDRSLRADAAPGAESRRDASRVFLLLAVAALLALLQFPFAAPIYFCYAAPATALATLAVVGAQRAGPRELHAAVLLFFLLFAVLRVNGRAVADLGYRCAPYAAESRLGLDRAGLRVPEEERREYERLVALVRRAARGPFVYAAPDAPEVAFLSGLSNPTRVFYDFLSGPPPSPEELLPLLARRGVRVAVVNRRPDFSPPLSGETLAALERRYPAQGEAGRFVVRWRP